MIVNQQSLNGISTGFKTIFNQAFSEAKTLYEQIATKVPSETGEESYKWLGALPKMKEWVGDRQIQNLTAHDYTIKNKDFEVTIGVKKNDIADDKIGIYAPMVQTIAQSAAGFPDELTFELLKGGFVNTCFDGKSFFSSEHKIGKKSASNKRTTQLGVDNYAEARSAMMSFTDDSGKSLRLVPNILVVPPALESMARKILFADQIDGTTNTYKDTAQLLVVPELSGNDTAWYLLCTTLPIKPLIYQERQAPKFTALDQDTDANVFKRKEFLYGVDARGNAGYGFWQMAVGSDGTGTK